MITQPEPPKQVRPVLGRCADCGCTIRDGDVWDWSPIHHVDDDVILCSVCCEDEEEDQ